MNLSFGQRIKDGLIQPWLTHGALDAIEEMDLSNKVVWMWGAGLGDAWLAKRCKFLFVVERNQEWLLKAQDVCGLNGITNVSYLYRPCNDCNGQDEMYCEVDVSPDVIIVDDAYRYECIVKALSMPRPLTLIVDNFNQDFVFICPAAVELMKEFKGDFYIQADHTNHEGRPWQTAIWHLT